LALLKLPYKKSPVNLKVGEHRSAENLARNPQGLVPTLVIDGETLTQSLAILEYLSETRSAGFLPIDAPGRARVRALSYAIAMEIAPICNLSTRTYVADHSDGAITAESWQTHFITKGLTAFETMLDSPATGNYCHGNSITLPDICLVPQVYNARRLGIDVTSYARISKIVDKLERNKAVASAHPDKHHPKG
jgi:maleylacetoacetate isomerase